MGGSGGEGRRGWLDCLTVLIEHLGIGHLVLLGVGILDIADRALGLGHVVGHALVTLGADADRPFDGLLGANLALPVFADPREVVGEIVGRAGTIGTVNDG